MNQQFELKAEIRTSLGKGEARRMRKDGFIPAVVYGGKQDPLSLTLSHKDIFMTLEHEAAYSQILDLNIAGKTEKVVLKAIERHVYKPKIMHVDFLRINANEKITMNVPLHFTGEESAVGIKSGGILSKLMTEIEIRCLPGNLPEFLELDVSKLELDHALHLSDIQLPKGVEFTTAIDSEHDHSVVSISKPKAASTETANGDDQVAGNEGESTAEEKTKE